MTKERDELHKTIWAIANDLRGSVDGWSFKQYVLGVLAYRYLSEKIASFVDDAQKKAGFYAALDDETARSKAQIFIDRFGYFVAPSELFCNVVKSAYKNENLNTQLDAALKAIQGSVSAHSEASIGGIFDGINFNDEKNLGPTLAQRNEKIADLLTKIASLPLNGTNEIDLFGDAYEFLMSMYAANAGKSGGEYFTPQDVSELLVRLATDDGAKKIASIYDPACGSGSLLLKATKICGKSDLREYFGKETNAATHNLARVNMLLHDISFEKFHILWGDTIEQPPINGRFDAVVSNPPYSIKWNKNDNPLLLSDDLRYGPVGVLAPKSKADFAFILDALYHLKEGAKAAIVCFPGIFHRIGAEGKIRKYLVENNFIDAIIAMPANLFFGTSIATCIMVLKRGKMDDGVLFIDASAQCIKVTNANRLSEQNIANIMRLYSERQAIEHTTAVVSREQIAANDPKEYILSPSTFITPRNTKEKIDIAVLNSKISQIVAKQADLRAQIDAIVADLEGGK